MVGLHCKEQISPDIQTVFSVLINRVVDIAQISFTHILVDINVFRVL